MESKFKVELVFEENGSCSFYWHKSPLLWNYSKMNHKKKKFLFRTAHNTCVTVKAGHNKASFQTFTDARIRCYSGMHKFC